MLMHVNGLAVAVPGMDEAGIAERASHTTDGAYLVR
jgi:hypothetical protein